MKPGIGKSQKTTAVEW